MDAFLSTLDHPFKPEIELIRQIMLEADSSISEGIKWNAPSFRTEDYFATLNLRAKGGVGIILHFGAKVREGIPERSQIEDPKKLLTWLAKDRAVMVFEGMESVLDARTSLPALVRSWIRYV